MKAASQPEESQQYLTFFLAGAEYAIEVLRVREIIEYGNVTRVPSMPTCIRGVINLRGSVLPVVDLAVKFGFSPTEPTKQTCIVVVEVELDGDGRQTVLGVLADTVNQVIELSDLRIQPPPAFGTRVQLSFLRGLGEVESGFILLLDVERLLTSDELLAVHPSLVESAEGAAPAPAS
jgi:purine-binding chemotaxis protein CheW